MSHVLPFPKSLMKQACLLFSHQNSQKQWTQKQAALPKQYEDFLYCMYEPERLDYTTARDRYLKKKKKAVKIFLSAVFVQTFPWPQYNTSAGYLYLE